MLNIEIDQKKEVLGYFSLVITLFLFIFILIEVSLERFFMANFLLALLFITLINHLIFKRIKSVKLMSYLITLPCFVFALVLYSDGGIDQSGIIWGFFIPFFAYYLHGPHMGSALSILYLLGQWTIYFYFQNHYLSFPYSLPMIAVSGAAYFIMCSFMLVFKMTSLRSNAHVEILHKKLEALSFTDELTGAANRRELIKSMQHELNRFHRNQSPVSLLMIDLDHFKNINDNYGHMKGDSILKHLSETCQEGLRSLDIWARYGGEEFCALLPDTSLLEAAAMAERLRKTVLSYPFEDIMVTISIGVATAELGDAPTTLIDRADKGLYDAKRQGRNRVCLSEESLKSGGEV
ncbi:diguanylate cyclase [Spirochaeta cellobiosiphila]|uniref:diguanylate cyclase n=1 Tax=Spirochaeta cellobiosiphila TaxID=504483 RepID=UPI0003F8C186|nr:diguanylate cyclase [Spirochaeta cellobiosiphila]